MRLAAVSAQAPAENSIAGTVRKVSFLGTHLQVAVRVDDGVEVSITQTLSSDERDDLPFAMGDTAHVTWPVARSLCFPEDVE